jgi:23S rRNA-intervening sequence protein
MKQSPIFSRTYDLLRWLIPATVKFPRQQRFVLAQSLQQEALGFQSLLIEAVHAPIPHEKLAQADAELDKLRTHLRLCRDLALFSPGQYQHVAEMVVEIGKLLGGWQKSLQTTRG